MESKIKTILAEFKDDPQRLIVELSEEALRLENINNQLVEHNAHLREEIRRVLIRN